MTIYLTKSASHTEKFGVSHNAYNAREQAEIPHQKSTGQQAKWRADHMENGSIDGT